MSAKKIITMAALLLHLFLTSLDSVGAQMYVQTANLFAGSDGGGAATNLIETYISDLSSINFDNRAMSTCIYGIWIFYDQPNYNQVDGLVEFAFGAWPSGFCFNFEKVAGKTSSLSYVGKPLDYQMDTLTLFVGTYFQGRDERTDVDLATLNLDLLTVSLIVTGVSPWTVYDGIKYSGKGVCIYPPSSTDYSPAFIHDTTTIGVAQRTIRSVRKGCWSQQIVFANFVRAGSNRKVNGGVQ